MTIYTTPESFEDLTPSVGQRFGGAIGQGLSSGLQLLAQDKLEKMKHDRLQTLLGELGGGQGRSMQEVEATPSLPQGGISDEAILAIGSQDPNLGRLLQSQKESKSKDTASRFKETKEVRKEILQQSKSARENDQRLGRMQQLNDSGKLVTGLYNTALQKLGLDFAALKNPDSQEFDKLSTDFLRNAKEIFGARVTNFEMDKFLKSIPTLSQTKEGRDRVIRNLQLFNRGAQIRLEGMQDVIQENGGVPPYDLGEQIEAKIGPQLDTLTQEFIAGPQTVDVSEELFDSLPSASDFKGRVVEDIRTGKRYRSDGKKWKVQK